VYCVGNGRLSHHPAFRVAVIDTLGAGDVWHGAFALALAERREEAAAVRFASAAAALKVQRFGGRTGTPRRDELDAFLERNNP
jgi:sulfofructose kinase